MHLIVLGLFFIFCSLQGLFAQSFKVNMEKYLKELDPVWDTTHTYFYEGAFIGNGLEGAMIYREDSNALRWDINRSDLTIPSNNPEYSRARFGIGKYVLRPKGKILESSMRIDLWNGMLKGNLKTNQGQIEFLSFVHHQTHALVIVLTEKNEKASLEFFPDQAKNILKYEWLESKALFEYPSSGIKNAENKGIKTSRQEIPKEQSYFEVANWEEKIENKRIFYSTISTNVPFSTDTANTFQKYKQISSIGFDKIYKSHQAWWHQFYEKTFVQIPDTRIASFYWIQRYKIGSSLREDGPLLDLMGPWYAYTPWPAIWWNLNVQLTYSPLYSLNHLDLGETLYKTLDKNIDNLISNSPEPFRHNSAGIGRVTTFDLKGKVNLLNSVFPYYDKEPGNLQWAMFNYFTQYKYSLDTTMLVKRILPLLKRSTNLYLNILYKSSDGKYHLPETFSPEYALTKDANFDLSLLIWGCKTLLEVHKNLGLRDPLERVWQDVLEQITPFPSDETGLRIGADTSLTSSHRHFSHLLMIYPLKILRPDNEVNRNLIIKSIDHWLNLKGGHAGYTYTEAVAMNALLERGDSALKYLNKFLDDLPVSTMYREAGPVIETPYSAITSIHEMFLQNQNDIISLFPALPNTWLNFSFYKLRTENAFLVSGLRKGKATAWISIESLQGATCKISPNIPLQDIKIIGKRKHQYTIVDNNTIQIDVKKGETVIITSKKQQQTLAITPFETWGKKNPYGMKLNMNKK